jgi:hypothetical protein
MWVIFGTKEATRRVRGGAQVVRHCEGCGEVTTFYEKDVTSTFRLYFIDVFDYRRHRVMACGGCGAHYATDELGARDTDVAATIGKKLEEGSEALGRVASSVGNELTNLASRLVGRPQPEDPPARRSPPERRARPAPDADLSDDDLAALDELEAKFRALEAEERKKSQR